MKCPKCTEGTIKKILVKAHTTAGFACSLCKTSWMEYDDINASTGHEMLSPLRLPHIVEAFVDKDTVGMGHEWIVNDRIYR